MATCLSILGSFCVFLVFRKLSILNFQRQHIVGGHCQAQSLSSFFQLNLVSDLYPTLHKILMCEFATVLIVAAINADATFSYCLHIPTTNSN